MMTGEIEIAVDGVKVLNRCNASLPFHIHDFHKVRSDHQTVIHSVSLDLSAILWLLVRQICYPVDFFVLL